jgi:signal transduction histidine kinase
VQAEYLNDVHESSGHLLSLINDVLDLSKVEAGKLELEPSPANIKSLLENSLTMIKEKALKNNIGLTLSLDGIPEIMMVDERKLKQIMYNLLSNAVKFTPDGGKVHLSAKRVKSSELQVKDRPANLPEDTIEISVSDNGIGIKEKDMERIFRAFQQVENSRARKYQGTGLGLSLTKSLVELHHGSIWVESEGEGKGSIFTFLLPVVNPL